MDWGIRTLILSLNGTDWVLSGWNRHQWLYDKPTESGGFAQPVVTRIPACVPGAVQTDLYQAGIIEDWNKDFNFFHLEWIEHREWVYEKRFSVGERKEISQYRLIFEGLDFSGYVFLNGTEILYFDQMHVPYEADVTKHLYVDRENVLRVVFLQPPEVDGQVGYTSRTKVLKSRYNYGWDWMPRLVNVGIFRDVYLRGVESAYLRDVYPQTDTDGTAGDITIHCAIAACEDAEMALRYTVTYGGKVCCSGTQEIHVHAGEDNRAVFHARLDNIRLWYPNGGGAQPLYTVTVSLLRGTAVADSREKKVGFRKLRYELPQGADPGHSPYSMTVNDQWVPIKGVNWVPLSPFYGSVTEEDYRYYLERFRRMHINLIRVWGGALLESETFYNLCDEMGILVWQDFPQSSSGIDNSPCEEPDFIDALVEVAKVYITRRRHHACLAVWCAGNELYDSDYHPMTAASPNIAALKRTVEELDPARLFLPGSPSGRVAMWSENDRGTGNSGDTHGPWQYLGPEEHYSHFAHNDSLLHSEIGAPACPRLETLKTYCSGPLWPPTSANRFWQNRGCWWLCDEELTRLFGRFDGKARGIEEYVKAFRYMQMEAIRYAASSIRRAGRKKAGMIIWMGNEPFPNNANTSVLEFDGCPKPAFYKLQSVYNAAFLGLAYASPAWKSGQTPVVTLFGCSDRPITAKNIRVSVYNIAGRLLAQEQLAQAAVEYTADLASLRLPLAAPLILVRITADLGFDFCEEYVFTVDGETPFGALLDMDTVHIDVERRQDRAFLLTNQSGTAALFVDCIGKGEDRRTLLVDGNYRCLLPQESILLTTDKPCAELTVSAMNSRAPARDAV